MVTYLEFIPKEPLYPLILTITNLVLSGLSITLCITSVLLNKRTVKRLRLAHITLKEAQLASEQCLGINAPNLSNLNPRNALIIRNQFLSDCGMCNKENNDNILKVLKFISKFL